MPAGGNTAALEICVCEREHAHLRESAALNGNDAAQSFPCKALSITILVGLLSACYQHCLSSNHTQRAPPCMSFRDLVSQ